MLETPVLFLIYNRPGLTAKVFERIRTVKPKHLFIAADGPKDNSLEEIQKCESARKSVLEKIDWECESHTLLREKNLGCKNAVSEAITWFFNYVEEGIILEDDCLPALSFFNFCETMLNHFRNNEKIMHISGGYYLKENYFKHESHYFSKYTFSWGWATWRRAWKKYSQDLSDFYKLINIANNDQNEITYWVKVKESLEKNQLNTWDFYWTFSMWRSRGISVNSTKNLIMNLGIGEDSTHTKSLNSNYMNSGFFDHDQFPILTIKKIKVNRKADRWVFENYNIHKKGFFKNLYGRFKSALLG